VKNPEIALMMTKTPIIVRDYFEDAIPEPVIWDLNSYVIHDPSLRNQMPAGTNLISERVRYKYYLNRKVHDDPNEPLLIQIKKSPPKPLNKHNLQETGLSIYKKKPMKAKGVRIKYYGNAYNLAKHSALYTEPRVKYNPMNSGLTLKDLLESNDMSKVLYSVYSDPTISKSYASTQPFNYSDSISEQERQQRNELIKRYGNRP
jgi:hypothetical protein